MSKSKLQPFDFIKSINTNGSSEDLMEGEPAFDSSLNPDSRSKVYSPYLVNRSLSYFKDTIYFADLMNTNGALCNRLQYDFLRHIVRKGKRFSKWYKPEKESEDLKAIKEYYGYSTGKAKQVLNLLNDEQLARIKQMLDKGGKG